MQPFALLLVFCCATLLLFGDRGVFSCNSVAGARSSPDDPHGSGYQGEFSLTLQQAGWLAAALMVGVGSSAPVFAQLSKRRTPFRLVGVGLTCFAVGAAACAAAPSYLALLAARVVVGIGCGPFISLASPLIDDAAPASQKSVWLSCLFLCIPTGFAGGYIAGGLLGSAYGWRMPFALEAAVMSPLALICLLAPAPQQRRHQQPATAAAAADGSSSTLTSNGFWADLRSLLSSPLVVCTVLALSIYNGSVGGFAFFGPKAARDIFRLESETADLLFGAITVGTGVLGTLTGGILLDAFGANVRNALRLCAAGVAGGAAACAAAFTAAHTLRPFCAAFAWGELGIFLIAAPANAVLLWSVAPELRPLALSLSEVSQHLLGDIPSPPALGWLQGLTGDWRLTMLACSGLLGAAALLFCLALCQQPTKGGGWAPLQVLVLEDEEQQQQPLGQAAATMAAEAEDAFGADPDESLAQPLLQP